MNRLSLLLSILITVFTYSCETDDILPTITISSELQYISEDLGETTITATLSQVSEQNVTVTLDTLSTATGNGVDYLLSSTIIEIPAGSLTGSVILSAIQDDLQEGNDTIQITVKNASGALSLADTLKIVIEDDDQNVPVQIIINEVLYDPSNTGLSGDANGDGKYAQNEDEFIEFLNLSSKKVDISGYKIFDSEGLASGTPTHIFPANTVVPSGGCIVVFGGGTLNGTFGGAIVQLSTSGDLNLNNASDIITLTNANDEVIVSFDITPYSDNPNESYTRFPDITGDFVQHHTTNASLLFSPGTKTDGVTPFNQ